MRPVVEAGTLEVAVLQLEAQGLDEVQAGAGDGAEPGNVAGVRRDLRLEEDYLHGRAALS